MRARKITERDAVLEIVDTGALKVGKENIDLKSLLQLNKSKIYREEQIDKIEIKGKEKEDTCKVHIIPYGSGDVPFDKKFKADTDSKVCILNFASSKHAGGGFMTGAYAQEENLCYHSNLYHSLSKHENFYEFNRQHLNRGLYTEGIIFTSDVVFFKQRFANVKPELADVITCAAPNKGAALRNGVKHAEVDKVMTARLEKILKVAIDNNVETLVLGAFGCGVFKNDINYVAMEIKKLLFNKGYAKYFKHIVIPTLTPNGKEHTSFVGAFRGVPGLVIENQ